LTPTAIAEIYNVGINGNAVNINITETPATATALMTDPTIAVTIGDHVEITTSITASAIFPSNIVVTTQININNVITEVLTASTTIGDNITISAGTNVSISSTQLTASALLVDPIGSQMPMIASASMPDGTASVTPNYYSLVKSLNPYLYIYDGKSTTTTNAGYQTGTFTKDLNLQTLQNLGTPLSLVGEGKSWAGPIGSSDGRFQFTTTTTAESFDELVSNGTFAWEAWVKPNQVPYYVSDPTIYYVDGPVKIALFPKYGIGSNTAPITRISIKTGTTTFVNFDIASSNLPLSAGNWAHIVIQSYDDGTANKRRAELWINGSRYLTSQYSYTNWTSDTATSIIFGSQNASSFGTITKTFSGQGIDEVAIYSNALTNSQIIQHNNFIGTLSPNVYHNATAITVDADSGNHLVLAIDNVNIPESPVTANALFVNKSISATPLTASALNTDVTVYWGWTINAIPATAYAEKPATYFLNDIYYQYVQTNIAPYRYVTFDSANAVEDYGTDADYSVVPTTIGGTVVNPDLGINGKYITDGVILNESEWNDSWSTGQNSYHSAFWFQRAADDASTTGLRVLWNLNGYKDNQHVVLYQYQGKLHMQFNNGSGTWIEQDSTNGIDLFDYQRHLVIIEFDHTNTNNNTVRLYVDAVLKMTVNLGAYTGSTTNASSADSGPNNEINNHPRLSVGCLITPFGSTALPVQPTNTKLIIDEIYWDKSPISLQQVQNLYAAMPDKTNKIIFPTPLTASDELVMPAFSISSRLAIAPLIASVEVIEPGTTADREVIYTSTIYGVTAELVAPKIFENKLINADIFVATAIFNSPGVLITIPGGPMTASIGLINRTRPYNPMTSSGYGISLSVNDIEYLLKEFSPYMKYLRIAARDQQIYKDMELL
jgi:hypothetical protein